MITIFDKLFYITLVINELTTEYDMSKREAISAINSSTLKKTLKFYPDIQSHDSIGKVRFACCKMLFMRLVGGMGAS